MRKINVTATKTFFKLIEKMGTETHLKLTIPEYLPLVIEQIGEGIITPYGKAKLFSLAHYYTLHGDAMRDPEMCFIVVDNRQDKEDWEMVGIYPQMFQQDNVGLYEESVCIEDNKVTTYKPKWQAGHTSFANIWLQNIRQQGFLK